MHIKVIWGDFKDNTYMEELDHQEEDRLLDIDINKESSSCSLEMELHIVTTPGSVRKVIPVYSHLNSQSSGEYYWGDIPRYDSVVLKPQAGLVLEIQISTLKVYWGTAAIWLRITI